VISISLDQSPKNVLSALIFPHIIVDAFTFTIIDAYKVARNCNGEEFCLEVPLDQVSLEYSNYVAVIIEISKMQ
jgi:hypothetical protein